MSEPRFYHGRNDLFIVRPDQCGPYVELIYDDDGGHAWLFSPEEALALAVRLVTSSSAAEKSQLEKEK